MPHSAPRKTLRQRKRLAAAQSAANAAEAREASEAAYERFQSRPGLMRTDIGGRAPRMRMTGPFECATHGYFKRVTNRWFRKQVAEGKTLCGGAIGLLLTRSDIADQTYDSLISYLAGMTPDTLMFSYCTRCAYNAEVRMMTLSVEQMKPTQLAHAAMLVGNSRERFARLLLHPNVTIEALATALVPSSVSVVTTGLAHLLQGHTDLRVATIASLGPDWQSSVPALLDVVAATAGDPHARIIIPEGLRTACSSLAAKVDYSRSASLS